MTDEPAAGARDFADVIKEAADQYDEVAVLLGNGFSIDYDAGRFKYQSLVEKADLAGLAVERADLFHAIDSQDFEKLIDYLSTAAEFVDLYGGGAQHASALRSDADVVRRGLADALASSLPNNTNEMEEACVRRARQFLSYFSQIFTLNYDTLLYWLVNRPEIAPDVVREDGFGQDGHRLVWSPEAEQKVHYLHGALHFFDSADGGMEKVRSTRKAQIVPGIRARLEKGDLPIVVTEGRRAQKDARIARHEYLRETLHRFGECRGALFIHGASMDENDDHIFSCLETAESDIHAVYVSLHQGSSRDRVRDRVHRLAEIRRENGGKPLHFEFYDAASAQVWRSPSRVSGSTRARVME